MSDITRWPADIARRQSAPVELESWELPHAIKQAADERMQHQAHQARMCCADADDEQAQQRPRLDLIVERLDARHGLALLALSAALVAACAVVAVFAN